MYGFGVVPFGVVFESIVGGVLCCIWVGITGSSISIASSSSAHETVDFDLSEKDESWFVCFCFSGVGLTFCLLTFDLLRLVITSVNASSGVVVMNS